MKKYTKKEVEKACQSSYSYAEVLRKLNRKGGGAQISLKRKIQEWNIDISHFTGKRWYDSPNREVIIENISRTKYSLEEVFKKESGVTQKVLRDYVKKYNLLEYKCQNCGNDGNWCGGIISLELDHINGDTTDNEIENLRYLCPNCHALTTTYRGKNKALKKQNLKDKCVESIYQPPKS